MLEKTRKKKEFYFRIDVRKVVNFICKLNKMDYGLSAQKYLSGKHTHKHTYIYLHKLNHWFVYWTRPTTDIRFLSFFFFLKLFRSDRNIHYYFFLFSLNGFPKHRMTLCVCVYSIAFIINGLSSLARTFIMHTINFYYLYPMKELK